MLTLWRRFEARLVRAPGPLARLHRDQQGGMLDYVMIIAAVGIPLFMLLEYLLEALSDYFGLIAYYVTWPFL
jgi:hypothetical protein